MVGDTITVVPDRRYVSSMTSYPNLIPMSEPEVTKILDAIAPYEFDRIYGGWWDRNVVSDGKNAVWESARRYIAHIKRCHSSTRCANYFYYGDGVFRLPHNPVLNF